MQLYDTARGGVYALEAGPLVTIYSCGITPYDSDVIVNQGEATVAYYLALAQAAGDGIDMTVHDATSSPKSDCWPGLGGGLGSHRGRLLGCF